MKYTYYIVDPYTNTVTGTDSATLAGAYVADGKLVINGQTGIELSGGGLPRAIEPAEYISSPEDPEFDTCPF